MDARLTSRERNAISALKRLAKRWPKGLWLFSASGSLHVMRTGPDGQQIHTSDDGIDQDFIVETIDIPNDGGDW